MITLKQSGEKDKNMASIKEHFKGLKLNSEMVKENKRFQENLKISGVIEEAMPDESLKLVCYFDDVEESLVLNKTNASIISETLGDDYDLWKGGIITLGVHKVPYQGKTVNAVTVKSVKKGN